MKILTFMVKIMVKNKRSIMEKNKKVREEKEEAVVAENIILQNMPLILLLINLKVNYIIEHMTIILCKI